MPFSGTPQHVVIYNVVQYNLRPKFKQSSNDGEEEFINDRYKELATQCWSPNSDDRPSSSTILNELKRM